MKIREFWNECLCLNLMKCLRVLEGPTHKTYAVLNSVRISLIFEVFLFAFSPQRL